MKRKKTTLLVSLFAVVIVFAVVGIANWSNIQKMIAPRSSVKISYYASNLEDLIKDSPLIVEAKVTDKNTDITYLGVNFVTTKIDITKMLKGDISEHEITLLQTDCKEDPIVEKGSSVLLFLHKYDGPITTNAYVCQGLYQGSIKSTEPQFCR